MDVSYRQTPAIPSNAFLTQYGRGGSGILKSMPSRLSNSTTRRTMAAAEQY